MGEHEEGPGWEQQQECERERYLLAIESLNRCAAAGVKPEDIKLLARECGIDLKHVTTGTSHAKTQ